MKVIPSVCVFLALVCSWAIFSEDINAAVTYVASCANGQVVVYETTAVSGNCAGRHVSNCAGRASNCAGVERVVVEHRPTLVERLRARRAAVRTVRGPHHYSRVVVEYVEAQPAAAGCANGPVVPQIEE